MTTADEFETVYGDPVFQTTFQALAEGLDGNGILDAGDLAVTAGTNTNALDVAATTRGLWYGGTLYTYAGGTNVLSLSSNTSGSPRWDLVYFDTGTSSPAVREGTPATKPDLPALQSGEFPLAAVYLPDGTTDVTDSEIKDYRVHGSAAEDVWVEDTAGDFTADDVEDALTELVQRVLGTDPGAFGTAVDVDVTSSPAAGTEQSYGFGLDALDLLQIYAEADGAGGIQNPRVRLLNDAFFQVGSDGDTDYQRIELIRQASSGTISGTNIGARLDSNADGRLQFTLYDRDAGSILGQFSINSDGDYVDDDGNVLYDASANAFTQARLGGPASSLTSYPLPIGDLNSPYALPSITDMNVDSTDLTDSTGPGVLYDASAGEFPRGVLDDERATTTVTTSTYASSDEELILVDTATIAASSTITLSSADAENGHTVVVADLTGSASTYPITVETESAETINGASSFTISTDYVGATFSSDGSNWVTTGTAPLDPKKQVEGTESGAVAAGEQGTLIFDHLAAGETLEISKAIFLLDDGTAVPSSMNLIIATLDNAGSYTSQTTIYSGDGATIWDGDPANSTGDPLASFTASSATTVAVLADNQTAGSLSIMAKATGERVP